MPRVHAVSAIQRLPLELLIEIFLATAFLHGPDYAHLASPPCAYLSYVCRTWRAAAIMCQQLWSSVPRRNLSWTKLCLERCHSSPIDIVINWSNGIDKGDVSQTIRYAASRVRSITIDVQDDHPEDNSACHDIVALAMYTLKSVPLPLSQLQEFQLHLVPLSSHRVWIVPGEILAASGSAPPRLLSIKLSCCMLQSPLRMLSPTLHTLILENVHPWGTCSELIRVLGSLTSLAVFEYRWTRDRTFGRIIDPRPTGSPVVHLKSLTRLVLNSFFVEDYIIFLALQLPPMTEIVFAPRTSHMSLIDEHLSEDAITVAELQLFAYTITGTLRDHLDTDMREGVRAYHTDFTRHGVRIVLERGVMQIKADDDIQTSSGEIERALSSIILEAPPFSTLERRDIFSTAYFGMSADLCDMRSISYDHCLSRPHMCADLKNRAHKLQDITLRSEEDVMAFHFLEITMRFPVLRRLSIHSDLNAPADMLQKIYESMKAFDNSVWSRVKLEWKPTTGTPDLSAMSSEVRMLLSREPST